MSARNNPVDNPGNTMGRRAFVEAALVGLGLNALNTTSLVGQDDNVFGPQAKQPQPKKDFAFPKVTGKDIAAMEAIQDDVARAEKFAELFKLEPGAFEVRAVEVRNGQQILQAVSSGKTIPAGMTFAKYIDQCLSGIQGAARVRASTPPGQQKPGNYATNGGYFVTSDAEGEAMYGAGALYKDRDLNETLRTDGYSFVVDQEMKTALKGQRGSFYIGAHMDFYWKSAKGGGSVYIHPTTFTPVRLNTQTGKVVQEKK